MMYPMKHSDLFWQDVDNIYHINNWRHFNLQDFSHLDSRCDTEWCCLIQSKVHILCLNSSPCFSTHSSQGLGISSSCSVFQPMVYQDLLQRTQTGTVSLSSVHLCGFFCGCENIVSNDAVISNLQIMQL